MLPPGRLDIRMDMPLRSFSRIAGFVFLVVTVSACNKSEPVTRSSADADPNAELFLVREEGKWGYMNQDGHLAIGPYFDRAWPFSGNRALVEVDGLLGYIDREGDLVIKPQYLDAWYFSDGLAPVQMDDGWAYIDSTGAVVAESEHPTAFVRPEGKVESLDIDRVKIGDLYGFRNADGQIVIDPQFEQAWHFSNGLARVKKNGKWGFIDRTGRTIVEPIFDTAWDFDRGLARVQIGNAFGYIRPDGEYAWEPTV